MNNTQEFTKKHLRKVFYEVTLERFFTQFAGGGSLDSCPRRMPCLPLACACVRSPGTRVCACVVSTIEGRVGVRGLD